ncbi:MAG: type II toxin-antitoxin system Phd/YefM family antitoxin [Patescibacteria group bacterium]
MAVLDSCTLVMYTLGVMSNPTVIQTATLRENLSQIIDTLSEEKGFMVVTRKGKPVSALVNIDTFEDMLAKTSSSYLKDIREARREYKDGNFLTHKKLFGEV